PSPRARAVVGRTVVAARFGSAVVDTAADGTGRVGAAIVRPLDDGAQPTGAGEVFACDLLAVSGGHSPVVHLHAQRRGALRWAEDRAGFVPDARVPHQRVAGAANGSPTPAAARDDGTRAGRDAARA